MKEIYVKPAIIEEITLDRKLVYADPVMVAPECSTIGVIKKETKYS